MEMGERKICRFTLGDAMVLVAASALALVLVKVPIDPKDNVAEIFLDHFARPSQGWTVDAVAENISVFTLVFIIPFVAAWTVALLALRLRRPRPSLCRLGRQPGAMAALLGSIAVSIATAGSIVIALMLAPDRENCFVFCVGVGSLLAAAMIVGGWIAMAVSGRWRLEPTWLDRIGRLLGAFWIIVAMAGI